MTKIPPHILDAEITHPHRRLPAAADPEPAWAPAIWILLGVGILTSWVTMLSFILTADRIPALIASGVGLALVAAIPVASRIIDRASDTR